MTTQERLVALKDATGIDILNDEPVQIVAKLHEFESRGGTNGWLNLVTIFQATVEAQREKIQDLDGILEELRL